MDKPILSPNFTIEDIHKIREYNFERTKGMSAADREKYYEQKADRFKKHLKLSESLPTPPHP